jgi:RNA polymerase sigma factor (sigma-70 family)
MGPEEQLAVQIQDMLRQGGQLTAQIQEALRQGDEGTAQALEKQLRALKGQLWELLKPHVRILAQQFRDRAERVGLTVEDLVGEAGFKFAVVIEKFDVGRGVELWTWLEPVLRNHIIDVIRRQKELLQPPDEEETVIERLLPTAASAEEEFEKRQLSQDILDCLQELDEQERTFVLEWEDGLGDRSQRDVGKDLGLDDVQVHRLKKRALRKLGECLKGKGYV